MAGKLTMACECGQGTYEDADLGMDDLVRVKRWWTEHNGHGRRVVTIAVNDADTDAELDDLEAIPAPTLSNPDAYLLRRPLREQHDVPYADGPVD